MLEEWFREITGPKKESGFLTGKKGKYVLVIVICIGLLALIWPDTGAKPDKAITTQDKFIPGTTGNVSNAKDQLEKELTAILGQVDGAGKVQVSLTVTSDGLKTFATNTRDEKRETQEVDNKGMERKINEQNSIRDMAVFGGDSLLIEQKSPEVVGVLVVAEGASDPIIKERLTDATTTLLNISPHQVRVLPRVQTLGEER